MTRHYGAEATNALSKVEIKITKRTVAFSFKMPEEKKNNTSVVKVNKDDNNALRQALDDYATKHIENGLGLKENHNITHIKLFLGTLCCGLALLAQFYPHPFPANWNIILACAIGYFVCSAIMQYVISYVQKDAFLFTKSSPKYEKGLSVSSKVDRYSLDYQMTIKDLKSEKSVSFKKPMTLFFDTDGVLHEDKFTPEINILLKQLKGSKNL
eukprot:TRINITY_DN2246_c0_g1_i1.p1 TRINITY_DN2246_c0_g1~~TRINITY_DN2246_c0_g1_i1.p1  ORF type:complete len:212 (+),score=34.66 TRINITY_DN2246_c0_g1_i1:51-686(+)